MSHLLELRLQRSSGSVEATFPFTVPAIRTLASLELSGQVTFFRVRDYSFDATPVAAVAYADPDHVALTRDFLNDPQAFLRRLG